MNEEPNINEVLQRKSGHRRRSWGRKDEIRIFF